VQEIARTYTFTASCTPSPESYGTRGGRRRSLRVIVEIEVACVLVVMRHIKMNTGAGVRILVWSHVVAVGFEVIVAVVVFLLPI
jgi:hypothetical protein